MGIQKIAKINSGSVRKRFGAVVGLNIFSPNVIPEISSRGSRENNMDSRQQSAGMTKGDSPCPES
jgi:hypothetical protein